jgi:hypothetical protein
MLHMIVEPEVQGGIRIGRRDDVPAGAATAEMIERGEAARNVIGRIEGCRSGGDESDAFGDLGQRRQQRERLERCRRMAALERVDWHVEQGHVVGHEEGVEFRRFQRLGEAPQMSNVEVRVGIRARISPSSGVDAGRPHECAEVQLSGRAHRSLVSQAGQKNIGHIRREARAIRGLHSSMLGRAAFMDELLWGVLIPAL